MKARGDGFVQGAEPLKNKICFYMVTQTHFWEYKQYHPDTSANSFSWQI